MWSKLPRIPKIPKPDWGQALTQFLIGGVVVSSISAASVTLSTKDAALLYALPLTYVPVLFFVWRHYKTEEDAGCAQKTLVSYVGQNVAGFVLLTVFCMSLYILVAAPGGARQEEELSVVHHAELGWKVAVSFALLALLAIFYYAWVCSVHNCQVSPTNCVLGAH